MVKYLWFVSYMSQKRINSSSWGYGNCYHITESPGLLTKQMISDMTSVIKETIGCESVVIINFIRLDG